MMASYEGAQHTVVAASVRDGVPAFMCSGLPAFDVSCKELVFEIGSITKVFTGILLCLLVEEGKVDPHAPLREMASELGDVPDWITPESLTSHTSGLPRIHVPFREMLVKPMPADPYADFARADMLEWIHNWSRKASRPKRRHAYSNLGVGLLGEAMALHEGKPFADLLAKKVTNPLGLNDTSVRLDEDQARRFLQPRNVKGKAVSPWSFQAMAAAGCLRSSARDMACFSDKVIRALNTPETKLDHAIVRSAEPVFGLGLRGRTEPAAQCSGWLSMAIGETSDRILYHDGGTAGSTCAVYVAPKKELACAILSNNGIAANLWASAKLGWSNQLKQVSDYFETARSST